MLDISIRRPCWTDIEELDRLFTVTIADAFAKEGVGDDLEGINSQIAEKRQLLREDLETNGAERFFLIACSQGKIVGTIAYGPCSELIKDCSDGKLKDVFELGSVYVLPEYQKKGIGTLLLNSMLIAFLSRGIEEFCLDSGYTRAQYVWQKKFGKPNIILKDYWREGSDHMIWHRKLGDTPVNFRVF
ncbi:MAG: GNAT family N-acetyltransferase [Firmicutes bacterium]|nr:GNAT family N-acetyltransferase [Bacillota bacterium]